ncbi:SUZ domain-containing protein 1 isoform X3 [Ornithorhynchus anatinus]|uniref:SUZ domain-containing protein 1 isoform X3 n=1 Tax=Ornithorhynchus anatinus TaxID=9258 RepID=UPI0019D4776B|nr:SUZ domain-containing protein 1 isoform X3 [Ornithorhynchus anatinus]
MEDEEVAESWEEAADSGLPIRHLCRRNWPLAAAPPNNLMAKSLVESGASCPAKDRGPVGRGMAGPLTRSLAPHQEIDRRLEKKLKITQKERKSKSPPKVPIVIQDDSLPSGPPPQIRILKRPTSNGVVNSPNSANRPALPVKSLAQREAEYAEARKRILGSASPEEEQEKPILDRPTRISQPEDVRQPNNVIRQPLGPDGSQGFKQRR